MAAQSLIMEDYAGLGESWDSPAKRISYPAWKPGNEWG